MYERHSDVLQDKTVAEIFIHYLESLGVTHVFGIPGGAIAPFLKLLRKSEKIRLVIGCQETGSAFMADGYARMSGKPGVVLVTAGPGATNALTGISQAHASHTPAILLSGQAATSHFHMGSLQDCCNDGVNIVEVFRHACAVSELVANANSFRSTLIKASRACLGAAGQAVHLSIPLDVAATKLDRFAFPSQQEFFSTPHDFIDEGRMKNVFDTLAQAKRPLVFLGSGCRRALRHAPARLAGLIEYVGALGIPVATSAQAKGLFPESDALSLGVYGIGGSEQANAYLAEGRPDVTLVVGSALGEWSTKCWDEAFLPTHALFQVDIEPRNIGRAFPVADGVVGDAGACIDSLIRQFQTAGNTSKPLARERAVAVRELKARRSAFAAPEQRDSDASPIAPQRLMRELGSVCDANTSLFVDAGNCIAWTLNHLVINPPAELFVSTTVASMGWASGAVIGAKIAAPDRTCICVTGDGSLLMNGAEILTAARNEVGAVWVVLNDNALGMVNQGEMVTSNHEFPLDDAYYQLGNPDLVAYACALGAHAVLVETPAQLVAALRDAVRAAEKERRPQVVVVRVDARELAPSLSRFESIMKQTKGDAS